MPDCDCHNHIQAAAISTKPPTLVLPILIATGDKQGFAKQGVKKNVQAYVPLPHATRCGICTRLCIIHFFLCGPSALDRAALIGEEICERITEQETLAKKRVVRMSARALSRHPLPRPHVRYCDRTILPDLEFTLAANAGIGSLKRDRAQKHDGAKVNEAYLQGSAHKRRKRGLNNSKRLVA